MKMYAYFGNFDSYFAAFKVITRETLVWTPSQNMLCRYQDALYTLYDSLDTFRGETVYKTNNNIQFNILWENAGPFTKNPRAAIMHVHYNFAKIPDKYIILLFVGMGTRLSADTFTILRAAN